MNKQAKLFQDQEAAKDDLSLTPVIKKKEKQNLPLPSLSSIV